MAWRNIFLLQHENNYWMMDIFSVVPEGEIIHSTLTYFSDGLISVPSLHICNFVEGNSSAQI